MQVTKRYPVEAQFPPRLEIEGRLYFFHSANTITPELAIARQRARATIGIKWSDEACTPGRLVTYSPTRPVW